MYFRSLCRYLKSFIRGRIKLKLLILVSSLLYIYFMLEKSQVQSSWSEETLANRPAIENSISTSVAFGFGSLPSEKSNFKWISHNPCHDENVKSSKTKDGKAKREAHPLCLKRGEPSMLIAFSENRLGNQMFSYAVLLAISDKIRRPAFMSPSMSSKLSKYFKVSMRTLDDKLYKSVKWKTKKLPAKYSPNSTRALSKEAISTPFVKFLGNPNSNKYFHHLRPRVLSEFRFHDEIADRSKAKLMKIRQTLGNNGTVLVGVHVRRQDMVKKSVRKHLHLPTLKYYEGAMKYFKNKYQYVMFVIVSDDIPWCEKNFSKLKKHQITYLKGTPPKEGGLDLAVLSTCDHVIFGIGTFGFWGGYLSNGEVVYCSDCITPQTKWLNYTEEFVIFPNWQGFSRDRQHRKRAPVRQLDEVVNITEIQRPVQPIVPNEEDAYF